MGTTVGAAAKARAEVWWCSEGRSGASHQRAEQAGLREATSLADLIERCEVLLSVCPPEAALDLAKQVAGLGYRKLYVDANAVAPATAGKIAAAVEAGGARFVDGGIVGPPAVREGTTRLFLSGESAPEAAALFEGSVLECIAMSGGTGAASTLKMCYAAYTKGSAALLVAIRAIALQQGVDEALLGEWSRSQPGIAERSEHSATNTAPKAWRFAAEMEEIAATFAENRLPSGFHLAAAEIFRRLASFKDQSGPEPDEVFRAVLEPVDRE